MAVNKQLKTTSLSIEVQNGVDRAGDPVFVRKAFANVRIDADIANVYSVADAVKGILKNTTKDYFLIESSQLTQQA